MFPLSDSIASRRFPFITFFLLAITVYVFFQEIISPSEDAYIQTYALIPSFVRLADYHTFVPFITSIFLHGGFLHIASNMWFFWVFGDNVEDAFGAVGFLVLYLACGIAGNVAQYLLSPQSTIPMLGASGAVAGVLGAYYVLFPHAKIKTLVPLFGFVTIVDIAAPFMLGYWFILQVISGAASLPGIGNTGGVAFWAHVVGFLTGVLFANMVKPQEESF